MSICNYDNSYRSVYDQNAQKLYCPLAQSSPTGPNFTTKEGYTPGGPPQRGIVDFPLKKAYSIGAGPVYMTDPSLAPGYEGYRNRDGRGTVISENYRNRDSRGTVISESFCPSCKKGGLGGTGVTQVISRPGV